MTRKTKLKIFITGLILILIGVAVWVVLIKPMIPEEGFELGIKIIGALLLIGVFLSGINLMLFDPMSVPKREEKDS